ncbi:MAG TPA: hypothetical protein DD723_06095 [Candidatus Omnitrophica bacterium]|nr:MAG: hypothetical protein A2Z81_06680 [Omnitrophica WOR_2 bacterium GWA2_45_18]HBR15096.1 hypothetical protein [Candidatus Omnitrophota bacterium]
MVRGKVKWFDQKMGYGYLVNAKGEEVLAYAGNIESQDLSIPQTEFLNQGQDVEFDTVSDQGEMIAVNIITSGHQNFADISQ